MDRIVHATAVDIGGGKRGFRSKDTVAGVPGMLGGMFRHFRSLRQLERDHGFIFTLLEEAENCARRAISVCNTSADAARMLIYIMLRKGETARALQMLKDQRTVPSV